MIIEPAYDNNKRYCAICKKRIKGKEIIVKFDQIQDQYKNTRKWFGHIDCVIKKLINAKEEIIEQMKRRPKIEIMRVYEND